MHDSDQYWDLTMSIAENLRPEFGSALVDDVRLIKSAGVRTDRDRDMNLETICAAAAALIAFISLAFDVWKEFREHGRPRDKTEEVPRLDETYFSRFEERSRMWMEDQGPLDRAVHLRIYERTVEFIRTRRRLE